VDLQQRCRLLSQLWMKGKEVLYDIVKIATGIYNALIAFLQ
jgi:hypothetical protein